MIFSDSLHHSLQAFAVSRSNAALSHSDVAGQDDLNHAAAEVAENFL